MRQLSCANGSSDVMLLSKEGKDSLRTSELTEGPDFEDVKLLVDAAYSMTQLQHLGIGRFDVSSASFRILPAV